MPVAAAGVAPELLAANTYGVLDPQLFTALTDTDAVPVPTVSVMELVVLEPLHPVPLTDQV